MSRVVAVVPCYRPDADDLVPLVRDLLTQAPVVVVADDASPCTADPTLRTIGALGAVVVRHRRNAGIARSLNDGLRVAREEHADWLLTVDQDSVLPAGYVAAVLSAAEDACGVLGMGHVGAVAAGAVADVSGALTYPVTVHSGVTTTAEVIQTGTLWSVEGLTAIGGFDETFGIDAVDAAACVRLRAHDRRIVLVPGLTLDHRVGDGRQVEILGRSVHASGHSPERRTTIVRNRLRLAPEEFAQSPAQGFRSLRRMLMNTALAVTVEDDRWAKAKASARGLLPRRR
jgi:rhamnosyltransferase